MYIGFCNELCNGLLKLLYLSGEAMLRMWSLGSLASVHTEQEGASAGDIDIGGFLYIWGTSAKTDRPPGLPIRD